MVGDNFLVRGYENGRHFATREKFYPTLFVPSKKKDQVQNPWWGICRINWTWFCKRLSWIYKKYDGVENFKIYGNERFIYQYISEKYPEEEIKFDTNQIKITTIDIEVKSENGFPDVESAAEEILLITLLGL